MSVQSAQRPGNPAQAEKPLKVSHSDVKSKERAERKMECLSPCFPIRKKGGKQKKKIKKEKEVHVPFNLSEQVFFLG